MTDRVELPEPADDIASFVGSHTIPIFSSSNVMPSFSPKRIIKRSKSGTGTKTPL